MLSNLIQNFMESIKTGLLGMGIVMVALYFLSLILDLMRYIFYPGAKQAKKSDVVGIIPGNLGGKISQDAQKDQDTSDEQNNNDELVAVITAALSEYLHKPMEQIRVGSIRQIHKRTPVWGMAARYQNVTDKL